MADNTPDLDIDDTIEIIEEVLDNKMFLVALALGAVCGGVALFLFRENRDNITKMTQRKLPTIQPLEVIDDDEDDAPTDEAVATPQDFASPYRDGVYVGEGA